MTPDHLMATLADCGVTVLLDGPDLILRPRARLTPDLLASVRAEKAALVERLRSQADAVAARVATFRASGPPWVLRSGLSYKRGRCFSCGDTLAGVVFGRCAVCSEALWRVLMADHVGRWPGRPQ
jgi:hypothetical protein